MTELSIINLMYILSCINHRCLVWFNLDPSEKYSVCRKDVLNGWRRVKDEHHNFGAVLRPYLNTDVDNRPPLDYLIQKIETLLS